MIYLSCRLHRPEAIDIDEFINFWKGLAQEIVEFEKSIWKIWDITQVFHDDVQSRVFTMKEQWESLNMVAKAAPCYLHIEQQEYGTTFTLLAIEEDALSSVRSFIQNICAPVELKSLNGFLQRQGSFFVQAIKVYESELGLQSVQIFDQPVVLDPLSNLSPSTRLLSLSAVFYIADPPLYIRVLDVNIMDHQIGFTVEQPLEEEPRFIWNLFKMADKAFKGDLLKNESG